MRQTAVIRAIKNKNGGGRNLEAVRFAATNFG